MSIYEFILERILYEKIRGNFKINTLYTLKTYQDVLAYSQESLKEIGKGSSRTVFALTSRFVLKVAHNQLGIAQNAAEVEIYTNPYSKPIAAKIIEYGKGYIWIISEIVKPINDIRDFKRYAGIPFHLLDKAIELSIDRGDRVEEIINFVFRKDIIKTYSIKDSVISWVKDVLITLAKTDLMPGDLFELSHWGKTSDGRVVLLDYGFTKDVAKAYK